MSGGKTSGGGRIGGAWTAICLVLAAVLAWPALYALLGPPPIWLPGYIRAVEGEVWVPVRGEPGEAYEFRLSDGRTIAVHCAPLAARKSRPCLQEGLSRLGMASGRSYRVTATYGAEHTRTGQMRNVLVHAQLGQGVLFAADEQLRSWRDKGAMMEQMSDPDFLFVPGFLAFIGFAGLFQLIQEAETRAWKRRRALSRRSPDPG